MSGNPPTEPEVLHEKSLESGREYSFRIPGNLSYTEGHFENEPIVPGVVLVDWVIKRIPRIVSGDVNIKQIKRVKFHEPLQPDDECTLQIKRDGGEDTIAFVYEGSDGVHSRGRILISAVEK